MIDNPYVNDIINQPEALETSLKAMDLSPLRTVREMLRDGQFDRIVLTGMGASLYALYPASLMLAKSGLPVTWVDSAELVHFSPEVITKRTLLIVASQSGRSAELMRLIDPKLGTRPSLLLSITNDLTSPLAAASSIVIPINTLVEETVSTRTYLITLAFSQLAALILTNQYVKTGLRGLLKDVINFRQYLAGWESHVERLEQTIGVPKSLVILGRGPSMGSVLTGSLILGEASKYNSTPMNAAQFRHGPMELIKPELTVIVLSGDKRTHALNLKLAFDIENRGSRVFWVASEPEEGLPWIQMPASSALGLTMAEMAPLQLLTLAIANQTGVEAGKFLYSGKITLTE